MTILRKLLHFLKSWKIGGDWRIGMEQMERSENHGALCRRRGAMGLRIWAVKHIFYLSQLFKTFREFNKLISCLVERCYYRDENAKDSSCLQIAHRAVGRQRKSSSSVLTYVSMGSQSSRIDTDSLGGSNTIEGL